QRSYGKGLVQNTKPVGYNSMLKLTTSKYYIPSGRCIQGVEYENGQPKDIPDELRSKFKTRKGRTVLDGGGVTPDVKLAPAKQHALTKAVLEKNLVFHFATQYVQGRDSITRPEVFRFDDYPQFIQFCRDRKFTFTSELEQSLQELKKKAAEKGADAATMSDI